MDANQYKDYVLTILFVKYVTGRYKNDPLCGFCGFRGGSFDDLVEAKGKKPVVLSHGVFLGVVWKQE